MPAGVSAWTPLANITLSSATASVTFSSISGTYRDLRLVLVAGCTSAASAFYRINGDTSSAYSWIAAEGDGSATASGLNANDRASMNQSYVMWPSGGSPLTTVALDFMDYSATNKHKMVLQRVNAPSNAVGMMAVRWASTSAINSITLTAGSNTWIAGSSFALYGVSA